MAAVAAYETILGMPGMSLFGRKCEYILLGMNGKLWHCCPSDEAGER